MTDQGSDAESHNKPCSICSTPRPVLVRCQIDESGKWNFVCPGKCWNSVSGGEVDAKGHREEHPYYRYGGMWKNRHADGPMNAKKPKKKKKEKDEGEKHHALDESEDADASQHVGSDGSIRAKKFKKKKNKGEKDQAHLIGRGLDEGGQGDANHHAESDSGTGSQRLMLVER